MADFLVSIAPVIIDDILTYQGDVHLNLLGGGGIHALAGCKVWQEKLGIISGVGRDFQNNLNDFSRLGIDTAGLKFVDQNTPRAWQIIQPGDVRIQILRDPNTKIIQILPEFRNLDQKYQKASGYHVLWRGTNKGLFTTLKRIRQINPDTIIVFEPTPDNKKKGSNYYEQLFKLVDVFTPNISEGKQITGCDDPCEIVNVLINNGCQTVALRMGDKGSIGFTKGSGELIKIPAAEAKVCDITGAGNAFAGGLLAGLAQKKSLIESLSMASVSASFAIQQFGICFYTGDSNSTRDTRLRHVLEAAKAIPL